MDYISISPSRWSNSSINTPEASISLSLSLSLSLSFFPSLPQIVEVAMANQPGRRRPFRFWPWGGPTPPSRLPAPTRRPTPRIPPRAPPPSPATPPPSRRPSKPSPTTTRSPSPTQEASQPQKEAATQEVSHAPPSSTLPVSQPESPTKKPVVPEAQDSRPTDQALSQTTEQRQPELPSRAEAQEESLSEPASQPPGAGSQTAQVSEPETVSVDAVVGTTPTQNLVIEREPKEIEEEKSVTSEEESKKELPPVEEKPQIDTESKQDSEPSSHATPTQNLIIEREPKEIKEEKSVTIAEESKKELPPVEEKTQIDAQSKQDSEPSSQLPPVEEKPQKGEEPNMQTSQPPQVEGKPKVEPKLIEETQPTQITQQEEKHEEIIEEKPNAELEVIKKTEPRSPKSETTPEGTKNGEPETKPEAQPAEKPTLSSDESKDTTKIESSTAEPDSEAPRPHADTREQTTKLRSPVKQIKLNDSKGRESTMGSRTIPWASPSHGGRTSLHKEINEGISKLVQKLKLGQSQQLGTERAVSIITLAGKNNGATLFVGHETTKKESVLHINKKAEGSSGDKEIRKQMLGHTDSENPAITASINSNVQGVNNSLMHESRSSEEDPGVHLVLSVKPNQPAKSKDRAKSN